MLDHIPMPYEVTVAQQAFDMGHATSHDMEILRVTYPERNYAPCDPLEYLFGINFPW